MGVIPILKNNCNPFSLFPFIIIPLNYQMKIFTYFTYLFLLQPPFLPTQPPFNQAHFFWKSTVKHTGVDITCFWKRLMEAVNHLSCSLLQKNVNDLQPKTISGKKSTLDVWEGPKEYQVLLWWILPQILTPPLNLKIWCKIPVPLFDNSPTSPYN